MAQDKKTSKKTSATQPQPAEDMFGRPTGPRHEDAGARAREIDEAPTMDAQYACGPRPHDDGQDSIDDIPDGDGLRSDLGKNPLPDVYWSAFPDGKPDDER